MIDRLFDVFKGLVDDTPASLESSEVCIRLVAASLMFEVARSDNAKQTVELETIEHILTDTFDVPAQDARDLMTAASEKVESAHDLYQFTQVINDQFDYDQKKQVLLAMWQVAFADGHIEAIEDHIIRRVSGLLHLSHADFIQMKIVARDG